MNNKVPLIYSPANIQESNKEYYTKKVYYSIKTKFAGELSAKLCPVRLASFEVRKPSTVCLSPTFRKGIAEDKILILQHGFLSDGKQGVIERKLIAQHIERMGYEVFMAARAGRNQMFLCKAGLRQQVLSELLDLDNIEKGWEDRREELLLQDGELFHREISWKVISFHENDAILDGVSIIPDDWEMESFKGIIQNRHLLAKGLFITRKEMLGILDSIGNEEVLIPFRGKRPFGLILQWKGL